jgi:hypothetical protein
MTNSDVMFKNPRSLKNFDVFVFVKNKSSASSKLKAPFIFHDIVVKVEVKGSRDDLYRDVSPNEACWQAYHPAISSLSRQNLETKMTAIPVL